MAKGIRNFKNLILVILIALGLFTFLLILSFFLNSERAPARHSLGIAKEVGFMAMVETKTRLIYDTVFLRKKTSIAPLQINNYNAYSHRLFDILWADIPNGYGEELWHAVGKVRGLLEQDKSSGGILTVAANSMTRGTIKAYFIPLDQLYLVAQEYNSNITEKYLDERWSYTYLFNFIPDALPPHFYIHSKSELDTIGQHAADIVPYDVSIICGVIPDMSNGEYYVLFANEYDDGKLIYNNIPYSTTLTRYDNKYVLQISNNKHSLSAGIDNSIYEKEKNRDRFIRYSVMILCLAAIYAAGVMVGSAKVNRLLRKEQEQGKHV